MLLRRLLALASSLLLAACQSIGIHFSSDLHQNRDVVIHNLIDACLVITRDNGFYGAYENGKLYALGPQTLFYVPAKTTEKAKAAGSPRSVDFLGFDLPAGSITLSAWVFPNKACDRAKTERKAPFEGPPIAALGIARRVQLTRGPHNWFVDGFEKVQSTDRAGRDPNFWWCC